MRKWLLHLALQVISSADEITEIEILEGFCYRNWPADSKIHMEMSGGWNVEAVAA